MKTKMVGLIAVVMMMASAVWAADTSALRPPAGSRMALVVFEDLQCPACARAEPLLEQAERNYKLPLVRHDFIIPSHTWSKEAHIMARYFDAHPTPQSPQLGEEFRKYIFANQNSIYKTNLREWADKFAAAHPRHCRLSTTRPAHCAPRWKPTPSLEKRWAYIRHRRSMW